MVQSRLLIRLGPEWSRFTYERTDVELLGTVQRGAQIGALARLPDGRFAQTNGDWVHPLNTAQVNLALKLAQRQPSVLPVVPRDNRGVVGKPVVVVRKKRRTLEGTHEHGA